MRKKRTPVTSTVNRKCRKGDNNTGTKSRNKRRQSARTVITSFHNAAKASPTPTLDAEQLVVYQKASLKIKSTKFTSQNLISLLNEPSSQRNLDLLDVGALEGPIAYRDAQKTKLISHVISIDLHPQSSYVQQFDFFRYPLPPDKGHLHNHFLQFAFSRADLTSAIESRTDDESKLMPMFDIVSLSLVINFLPSPEARGAMLRKAILHLSPAGTRLLYIVVPLACVDNSRYMTEEHFTDGIMGTLACTAKSIRRTTKLWCALFHQDHEHGQDKQADDTVQVPRRVLCGGRSRNNFSIVL